MKRDGEAYKGFDSFFSQTTTHSEEHTKLINPGKGVMISGTKANPRINKDPF